MSEIAEPRRVKPEHLKPGDRFMYGEIVVTVTQQLIQDSVSIRYRKDEVRKRERHEDLADLFPNGIPLLEPEKPTEWNLQFRLCGLGCRARFFHHGAEWDPTEWLSDNFAEGTKYEVTIKEVPQ